MSHTLELPGLHEDNPRDFLAALGLLRMLHLLHTEAAPRLSWKPSTGHPSIESIDRLPVDFADQLWSELGTLLQGPNPILEPVPVESVSAAELRSKLLSAASSTPAMSHLISISAQIPHEKSARRSDFIIESGQRRAIKGVLDMLSIVDHGPNLRRQLDGTADPVAVSNSSRWNPAEFRSAAYTTTDPAKTDLLDHPGLNVRAFVGLTFYPVVDSQRGAATSGFSRVHRSKRFSWPIWDGPLSPSEIGTLLHRPEVHSETPAPSILVATGIRRVWRSRKFGDANNKYFATAEPAF